MYVYIYVFMYVCMYLCMHICMYLCMFVCMYVCVCVCMYMYTYMYAYMHLSKGEDEERGNYIGTSGSARRQTFSFEEPPNCSRVSLGALAAWSASAHIHVHAYIHRTFVHVRMRRHTKSGENLV